MEKREEKRKEEEEEEEKRKEERRKGKRKSWVWTAMILYRKIWNLLSSVWKSSVFVWIIVWNSMVFV